MTNLYALLCSRITFTQFILDLHTFVTKSALSCLRAFWGALLAKNLVGGGTKIFYTAGVWLLIMI